MSFPFSPRRRHGKHAAQAVESSQPTCGADTPAMRLMSLARCPAHQAARNGFASPSYDPAHALTPGADQVGRQMADRRDGGGGPAEAALSRLLSISQTATYFGNSERTVRRWIASGRLPVARVGRSVFIPVDEVRRIIQMELVRRVSVGANYAMDDKQ